MAFILLCQTQLVGGDGPKLIELLQMREKYRLQDRVELLGSVPHEDVSSVSIYLSLMCKP